MTFGRGGESRPWNVNKDEAGPKKSADAALQKKLKAAEKALVEVQKKLDNTVNELQQLRVENETAAAATPNQSCPKCAESEAARALQQEVEAELKTRVEHHQDRCNALEKLARDKEEADAEKEQELAQLRSKLEESETQRQQLLQDADQAQLTSEQLTAAHAELKTLQGQCALLARAAEEGRAAKAQMDQLEAELCAARGDCSVRNNAIEEGQAAKLKAEQLQKELDRVCSEYSQERAREAGEGDTAKEQAQQLRVQLEKVQGECTKQTKAAQEGRAVQEQLSWFKSEVEADKLLQIESKREADESMEQQSLQLAQKHSALAAACDERDQLKSELVLIRSKHETELESWGQLEAKHRTEQQAAAKEFDQELGRTQAEAAEAKQRITELTGECAAKLGATELLQQELEACQEKCRIALCECAETQVAEKAASATALAREQQLAEQDQQLARAKEAQSKAKKDALNASTTVEELSEDLAQCVKKNDELGETAEKLKKKLTATQKALEKEREKVAAMERKSEVEKKFLVSEVKHSMQVAASQEKTALALSKRLGQPAPPQKKKSDRSGSRIDASSRAGDQSHLLCTDQENTPDDELITVGDTTFVAPPTALPLSARASTASSAKKPNSSGSKRRSSIAEAKNFSKSSNKKPDASITDFKLLSKLDKAKKNIGKHSAYGKVQR